MAAAAPAEYMIFGFPGNQFNGSMAPALANLVDKGLIRLRDLLFIIKDADGNIASFEIDEVDELKPFLDVKGEAGGLLTPADIKHAAAGLEPNSSAALLIWEDLWAAEFADAVPATTAVRATPRTRPPLRRIIMSIVSCPRSSSSVFVAGLERGRPELVRDPRPLEHHTTGAAHRLGEVRGPEVLPDEERR